MTAIGKMMVIFVFLITLVWCGLTANTFVTRTNWKKEAEASEKKYREAAQAATEWQKKYNEIVSASEAAIKVNQEDANRFKTQLSTLYTQYNKLIAEYNKQLASLQSNESVDVKEKATYTKDLNELTTLRNEIKKLQDLNNQLLQNEEKARNLQLAAEIARDAQIERADQFQERIRKLSEQLDAYVSTVGPLGAVATKPIPPQGFRASVTARSDLLVEINEGLNAGLKPGMVLMISRTTPSAKYLGELTITERIDPERAVGTFKPARGLREEDYPRKGDMVQAK